MAKWILAALSIYRGCFMRIIFMGSAGIACPSLAALADDPQNEIVGVVTQPDKPKGRSLRSGPCDVKARAEAEGLSVMTPVNVNDPACIHKIQDLDPDLIVVVAYGQILCPDILKLKRGSCINLHMSLLPRYRGAAPIQWAIVNGDRETGVTTMYINEKMDAGDIIYQESEPIKDDDTAGTLHDRLAVKGAALLARTVSDISSGKATARPQDHSKASFAPKIRKSDGRIDWNMSAEEIYRRVRGFNPWPGCYCITPAGMLKIHTACVEKSGGSNGVPGSVLNIDKTGPLVQTGNGGLRLVEVQPEGKKRMTGHAYAIGCRLQPGNMLS